MKLPTKSIYMEQVFLYLEELEYPALISGFEPEDVAHSTARTIQIMYNLGISVRMCALSIYGLTWELQILPLYSNSVKH